MLSNSIKVYLNTLLFFSFLLMQERMVWRIIFLARNIERESAGSISTLPPGNMSRGNGIFHRHSNQSALVVKVGQHERPIHPGFPGGQARLPLPLEPLTTDYGVKALVSVHRTKHFQACCCRMFISYCYGLNVYIPRKIHMLNEVLTPNLVVFPGGAFGC